VTISLKTIQPQQPLLAQSESFTYVDSIVAGGAHAKTTIATLNDGERFALLGFQIGGPSTVSAVEIITAGVETTVSGVLVQMTFTLRNNLDPPGEFDFYPKKGAYIGDSTTQDSNVCQFNLQTTTGNWNLVWVNIYYAILRGNLA
jgi:hypothetical protein